MAKLFSLLVVEDLENSILELGALQGYRVFNSSICDLFVRDEIQHLQEPDRCASS